jgi:purine-binding chemotaxis protein CheW
VNDSGRQFVLFRVGSEEYGLPIGNVSSIIRYETVTPVPRAPVSVQGVIDLRGRVVPVVDLGRRLFGTVFDPTPRARIIVTETPSGAVGLAVDAASEVATFAEDQMMAAPEAALPREMVDAFSAVVHLNGRLIILLDLERVLPKAEYELAGTDTSEGGS